MKSLMIQEMLELCVALIYEVVLEIEEELMKPLSVLYEQSCRCCHDSGQGFELSN